MEYRIQDLLKNLIPGFVVFCGSVFLLIYCRVYSLKEFKTCYGLIDKDLWVLILPFLFYVIGYVNDILSSTLEYFLYELGLFKRPSFLLLNDMKSRYKLANLENIKTQNKKCFKNNLISKEDAYSIFKEANQNMQENKGLITEFYMSYVFARNLMTSFLILLVELLLLWPLSENSQSYLVLTIIFLLLFVIFIFRWKQKAIYYSLRILRSLN